MQTIMSRDIDKPLTESTNSKNQFGFEFGISNKFAVLNRLIARDLNSNTSSPTFSRYSKDDIATYISNPYRYEKQLRQAVVYLYGASPHFRRLIQYFVSLSDFAYYVSPFKVDPRTANVNTTSRNYRKTLNMLSSMNVKTQFPKILTICLREDCCYCTCWMSNENITIQILPSDYCAISTIEGNVPNVTFDFSYFDTRQEMLEYFPAEFGKKYRTYLSDRTNKWIELDSPTSFAVKCNSDIIEYALPPFAGILREVYDLEDYKALKLSKTAIENYALLVMKLAMDKDGNWLIDYDKAKEFWHNLDAVMPEEVGSVLSPMDIDKINFEKSNTGDTDTVADAEQNLFSAAGVSSLLFNNPKASANALALSIKADQAITYGIVKNIEDAINRLIQSQGYGKNFKLTILDVSPFNREEMGNQYLKAAQYGFPTLMMYAASQGLSQAEFDSMNFLENSVLDLKNKLVPLRSSSTLSANNSDSSAPTDEGGRPPKEGTDLTDSGEQSSEDKDDW